MTAGPGRAGDGAAQPAAEARLRAQQLSRAALVHPVQAVDEYALVRNEIDPRKPNTGKLLDKSIVWQCGNLGGIGARIAKHP